MKPSQQILIPVIIPNKNHWVTLQIRSYRDSTIHLRCYDSMGSRYIQEMDALRGLLTKALSEKTIEVHEAQTLTIHNSDMDMYCGGYTARLISFIFLNALYLLLFHFYTFKCENALAFKCINNKDSMDYKMINLQFYNFMML